MSRTQVSLRQVGDSATGETLDQQLNTQKLELDKKANKTQENWNNAALVNAWVATAPQYTVGYYKDEMGVVRLRGRIKGGVETAGTVIFTLPAGYRPTVSSYQSTMRAYIDVSPAGNVTIWKRIEAGDIALDSISFRAEL